MTAKEEIKNIDIELAIDVKNLVQVNTDVTVSPELKAQILKYDDDELLEVTKIFGSLNIVNVEVVNEELLKKKL